MNLFQLTAQENHEVDRVSEWWERFCELVLQIRTIMRVKDRELLHALREDYASPGMVDHFCREWQAFSKELLKFRAKAEALDQLTEGRKVS